MPPGAQCSSQARGIWGSSHSPSWLRSPTSLFLTGSRAGAFSVSRLFYSCRSPGRHQNSHECPTAALVSAPGLSCSAGGLSSTWPLGPLVTSSLPGPPGVFPFLEGGLLTMTASFLLCCSYERLILQPHPAFLILICSAVPPPRLTSFLMGPPSHSPSHTAFSASISEGQGEHTGIILLRKKKIYFLWESRVPRLVSANRAAFVHPSVKCVLRTRKGHTQHFTSIPTSSDGISQPVLTSGSLPQFGHFLESSSLPHAAFSWTHQVFLSQVFLVERSCLWAPPGICTPFRVCACVGGAGIPQCGTLIGDQAQAPTTEAERLPDTPPLTSPCGP